jgi:putative membrane protein
MFRTMILTCTVLGLCGVTLADDDRTPMTAEGFVKKVSAGGTAEVAFAKMAMTKATSGEVRKFAQMLVEDHTKVNKQLAQIAETKQIPIAQGMDKKHQEKERELSGLTGEQFDREYMKCMVKSHEDGVALFTKFSESGPDAELKGFATQTLPTLKMHLKHAKEIAEQIK